jgi:hypothetical protein
MEDEALVEALEACTLRPEELGHAAHVRAAWQYLRVAPFGEAGDRFCSALRRFAAAHGAASKFHETITWAYLALINERRTARPAATFASFAEANPDLLDNRGGALSRLYDAETLRLDLARRVFVLPRPHGAIPR